MTTDILQRTYWCSMMYLELARRSLFIMEHQEDDDILDHHDEKIFTEDEDSTIIKKILMYVKPLKTTRK